MSLDYPNLKCKYITSFYPHSTDDTGYTTSTSNQVQCGLIGTLSQGAGIDFYCMFHHDVRQGRAEHSESSFVDWYQVQLDNFSTYPKAVWNRYTCNQLWAAISQGQPLPEPTDKPPVENTSAPDDYAERAVNYMKQSNLGKITHEAVIDLMHHEFGCVNNCQTHQGVSPTQKIRELSDQMDASGRTQNSAKRSQGSPQKP